MQFPKFKYDPSRSYKNQFNELCRCYGWEGEARLNALEDLKTAVVEQFNEIYGQDPNDIKAWRNLCEILRVSPIPRNLSDCREVSIIVTTRIHI